MRIIQLLTPMYAVFAIAHSAGTEMGAVCLGGGYVKSACYIDVDDQGRELFCPFCAV